MSRGHQRSRHHPRGGRRHQCVRRQVFTLTRLSVYLKVAYVRLSVAFRRILRPFFYYISSIYLMQYVDFQDGQSMAETGLRSVLAEYMSNYAFGMHIDVLYA